MRKKIIGTYIAAADAIGKRQSVIITLTDTDLQVSLMISGSRREYLRWSYADAIGVGDITGRSDYELSLVCDGVHFRPHGSRRMLQQLQSALLEAIMSYDWEGQP